MSKNKVLIIGSGGREHALGWKLSQSPLVEKIYFAPGNAGTELLGENIRISPDDMSELLEFAKSNKIDLTVVGPEAPLVNGIVDLFEQHKLKIFGPSKFAAQLEGSKSFSKSFMKKYKIPTADYDVFTKDQMTDLTNYLIRGPYPVVLKADGLAAGKGVVIAETFIEVMDATKEFFIDRIFGESGDKLVVEEFLVGEEASLFVLTDGKNYRLFPVAQDHKRVGDDDTGKNTGGMGAYAPAGVVTKDMLDQIEHQIVRPTLDGMKNEGHPYMGLLYIGLMITKQGAKVIEYNCRFGDPECQIEMMLTESDLFVLMNEIAEKNLTSELKIKEGFSTAVVLCSHGYPDKFEKGKVIKIEDKNLPNQMIFHAGTVKLNDKLLSNGGRVLNSVAWAETLETSIEKAYQQIKSIEFEGMYYRKDIGKKGLERKENH